MYFHITVTYIGGFWLENLKEGDHLNL